MKFWMVLLPLLAGCAADRPEGSTLDVTVVGQDGARPAVAGPLARRMAEELMATTLIERDDAGQLVGALASSWRFVDEGQSLILRLRPVKWSDGKPLVANDVVAGFRKNASPPTPHPVFRLSGLVGAGAVAAGSSKRKLGVMAPISRVVELRLVAASPLLLDWLAEPAMSVRRAGEPTLARYRLEALQADDLAPNAKTNSVSTVVLQRVAMEPSADARPAEVSIHSVAATDVASAVAAFRRGSTDIVAGEGLAGLFEARIGRQRDALRVEAVNGVYGWRVNTVSGPLADPALRRALMNRIDRAALARSMGVPTIQPETGLLPASMRAALPQLPAEAATETGAGEAAKVALDTSAALAGPEAVEPPAREDATTTEFAGETEAAPVVLRLLLPPGREHALVAERVAVEWRALGIALTLQIVDPILSRALVKKGEYDLVLDETSLAVADPAALLDRFRCRSGAHCNRQADAALAAAIILPPDQRAAALARAEALLLEAPPFIPLFTAVRWALVAPGLYGWVNNPSGVHPLARIGRGRPER